MYNLANKGRNYVRIFINSVMNREFEYSNDVFALGETGISIGSSTATIDVYGIRIYKQALSSQQIQQDYKAALSTATEKLAYQTKNDILGDDNTISITKTQQADIILCVSLPMITLRILWQIISTKATTLQKAQ